METTPISIVTVGKGGRITIPSSIRRKLNLKEGDMLLALNIGDTILLLKKINIEGILRDLADDITKTKLALEELVEDTDEDTTNRIAYFFQIQTTL